MTSCHGWLRRSASGKAANTDPCHVTDGGRLSFFSKMLAILSLQCEILSNGPRGVISAPSHVNNGAVAEDSSHEATTLGRHSGALFQNGQGFSSLSIDSRF